jgi:hypothetical protein
MPIFPEKNTKGLKIFRSQKFDVRLKGKLPNQNIILDFRNGKTQLATVEFIQDLHYDNPMLMNTLSKL